MLQDGSFGGGWGNEGWGGILHPLQLCHLRMTPKQLVVNDSSRKVCPQVKMWNMFDKFLAWKFSIDANFYDKKGSVIVPIWRKVKKC